MIENGGDASATFDFSHFKDIMVLDGLDVYREMWFDGDETESSELMMNIFGAESD